MACITMDEGCKVNLKINDSELSEFILSVVLNIGLSTQKGCPSRVPDFDF